MGRPDDCNCHCGSGEPPIKKYDCVGGFCVESVDGPYINDPTCETACTQPPTSIYYNCVDGYCIPSENGFKNDPTCGGIVCPVPPQGTYECYLGLCLPWWNGQYSEPTCGGSSCDFPPQDPDPPDPDYYYHYLLINCSDENDVIYRKSPTPYWQPYGDVFVEDSKCYKMVGLDLTRSALYILSEETTTCEICTAGGCIFTIRDCLNHEITLKIILIGSDIFNCNSYIGKVFRMNSDPTCWEIIEITTDTDVATNPSVLYDDCTECAENCPYYPCDPEGSVFDCPTGYTFDCITCDCEQQPDPDPNGSCCVYITADYSFCTIAKQSVCAGWGGTWLPALCEDRDCGVDDPPVDPFPLGACCTYAGCVNYVTSGWCDYINGDFHENTLCIDGPCNSPCDVANCGDDGPIVDCVRCAYFDCDTCGCVQSDFAACCKDGQCYQLTLCDCEDLGGIWNSDKNCGDIPNPCAAPPE